MNSTDSVSPATDLPCNSLLETALDTTDTNIAVVDAAGVICYSNQAWDSFCRMNGGSKARCGVGSNYLTTCEHVCGEEKVDAFSVSHGIRRVLEGSDAEFRLDYPCHSPIEERWFQLRACGFRHRDIAYAIIMHENVTVLKQQELLIQYGHQRFKDVVSAAGEYIWEIDQEGNFTYLSDMITTVAGYAPDELLGRSAFALMPSDEADRVRAGFGKLAETKSAFRSSTNRMLHKNGSEIIVQTSGVPVIGDMGELRGYRGANLDITEHHLMLGKIKKLALFDALTGLPNRIKGFELIDLALEAIINTPTVILGVFSIDIDFFGTINESMGHGAGNQFLIQMARRLEKIVGRDAAVCRFGDDRFVVLAESEGGVEPLGIMGTRMLRAIAEPVIIDGLEVALTASIGIACSPQDGVQRDELLGHADMAMKLARRQGRCQCAFFKQSLAERVHSKLTMEARLRKAANNGDFKLVYQPQHHAETGMMIGMEALLRWHDRELGSISPVEFIPLAEERGLIVPIGEWVLLQACNQIKLWATAGLLKVPMAVNISPMQFRYPGFIKQVQSVDNFCIPWMELELTESCLLESSEDRRDESLHSLKEMGFKLSVDDFGTGYSSLSHLHRLPINRLKIDRSFITDLPDDKNAVGIVKAIVAMAQALGLELIAEGVENREQVAFLVALNCSLIQGFYFNKPMEVAAIERLLQK